MTKFFLSVICAPMVIFWLSAVPLNAADHDGEPSLCEHLWESEGAAGSGTETTRSLRTLSECGVVNLQTLDSGNGALVAFLEEIERDLWSIGRLPQNVLYRYTLTIINDWEKDVSVNLSHWQVIHSPYSLVISGFAVDIPACSYARIQFLSPWAPELYGSPVNVGGLFRNGEWSVMGVGEASILTPVWYQYFSEGMQIAPLPPVEAKTEACFSR